jgi:RNA polymerase sigma factor (sigma-70 family)
MTRDEYGAAYQEGYRSTVRFLVSRGSTWDDAEETAQAAWTRGWERLGQLRDPQMVLTWMNSIALNIDRSFFRRKPLLHTLPEIPTTPKINFAAIDVERILQCSRKRDRFVLQRHYLEGFTTQEIASERDWSKAAVRSRLLRARRSAGQRIGRVVRERNTGLGPDAAAAA